MVQLHFFHWKGRLCGNTSFITSYLGSGSIVVNASLGNDRGFEGCADLPRGTPTSHPMTPSWHSSHQHLGHLRSNAVGPGKQWNRHLRSEHLSGGKVLFYKHPGQSPDTETQGFSALWKLGCPTGLLLPAHQHGSILQILVHISYSASIFQSHVELGQKR